MMTEIELTPRKQPNLSLTLDTDFILESNDILERKHRYKKLIHQKCGELLSLVKSKEWIFIKTADDNERVQLYEQPPVQGMQMLKAEVILQCSAERLIAINTDYSYVTRSQWDGRDVHSIDKRESYTTSEGNIDVIQTVVKMPPMLHKLGVQSRHFLGIQWMRYNSEKKRYMMIFTTCPNGHPLYTCPPGSINATSSTLMTVLHLGENVCHVSIITQVTPGGLLIAPILSYYKRRLRDRMILYEHVCNQQYESIYARWMCTVCNKENDAYLLDCKYCHVPRYWKCLDKGCGRLQPNHGESFCIYCKEENGLST